MNADCLTPGKPSSSIDQPSLLQVLEFVERLDGIEYTEVLLADGDASGLLISGGFLGRYLCERIRPEKSLSLMVEKPVADEDLAILQGGPPDFPAAMVIGIDQVERAISHFIKTCECDPNQAWEYM